MEGIFWLYDPSRRIYNCTLSGEEITITEKDLLAELQRRGNYSTLSMELTLYDLCRRQQKGDQDMRRVKSKRLRVREVDEALVQMAFLITNILGAEEIPISTGRLTRKFAEELTLRGHKFANLGSSTLKILHAMANQGFITRHDYENTRSYFWGTLSMIPQDGLNYPGKLGELDKAYEDEDDEPLYQERVDGEISDNTKSVIDHVYGETDSIRLPSKKDKTESKIDEQVVDSKIEPLERRVTQLEEEVAELQEENRKITKKLETIDKTRKVEITITAPKMPKVTFKEAVHHIFEKVLFHIHCGDNVMLVGPSGCGKTELAMQLAKAMKKEFGMFSFSGGATESKLLGRNTPNITNGKSVFQAAKFVKMAETGGLFLMDEVDAADPNVLMVFNSVLSNRTLELDREKNSLIKVHPKFVVIAAANTYGHGADRNYVGRNQQDLAFVKRFHLIDMDYDPDLEKKLIPDFPDMVDKFHEWRQRARDNRLERIIDTRLLLRAANWLRHGKDMEYVEQEVFTGWREDEKRKVKGGY